MSNDLKWGLLGKYEPRVNITAFLFNDLYIETSVMRRSTESDSLIDCKYLLSECKTLFNKNKNSEIN
jgi:hypothetical protein